MIKSPIKYKSIKKINQPTSNISNNNYDRLSFKDFCKLTKIRSGNKIVKFELYDYQELLIQEFIKHQNTVVIKSRQLGLTQLFATYFLYSALKNKAYSAIVLSKSQQDTSLIARRMREMINSHKNIKLENDNLSILRFKQGGTIYFKNSKPDSVRGIDSVSDILIDECAFIDNIEDIYTSVIPCMEMAENPHLILLSTPNGQGNFYYEKANNNNQFDLLTICENIRKNNENPVKYWTDKNGWLKFIIHWKAHPKYSKNPNYIENIATKKQLPIEKVKQEYDLSFTSSDIIVFSLNLINKSCCLSLNKSIKKDYKNYYISIDTSGRGDDYFVISIIGEISFQYELIKYYRYQKKNYNYYKTKLFEIIDKFNPRKLAIETNGIGIVYTDEIKLKYPRLYIEEICTNRKNKESMITRLIFFLERNILKLLKDENIITEMKNFQYKNNTYRASSGKSDDIIMTLALATNILNYNEEGTVNQVIKSKIKTF
jgi:hypothetical protein